jgi:hypothetical protein
VIAVLLWTLMRDAGPRSGNNTQNVDNLALHNYAQPEMLLYPFCYLWSVVHAAGLGNKPPRV